MKKSLTATLAFSSLLAVAGISSIAILDSGELQGALKRSGGGQALIEKDVVKSLASDTLVFETAPIDGEFSVEIEGLKSYAAGHFILTSKVIDVEAHEIDRLAALKKKTLTNSLTVLRTKEGKVVLAADKSVGTTDYSKLPCSGCEGLWHGYAVEHSVTTAREAGSGMASGRREAGSGMATGRRAKIVMDRDTGRSKGRIAAPDNKLLAAWFNQFSEQIDQELIVVFNNLGLDNLAELQKAYRVRVKFPVIDGEQRTVEFAIKENGIKIAIEGGNVTLLLKTKHDTVKNSINNVR